MKQILVVDDVPEVRLVYAALLNSSDVAVFEADDGQSALAVLETEQIDLVLTDCQMPNMTGPEMMRIAREQRPELPFIVVSANATEDKLKGLNPYAVIPKPFRLAELKELVAKALDES